MYFKLIPYFYLIIVSLINTVMSTASLDSILNHYEIITTEALQHKIIKRGIQQSNHHYNSISELNVKMLGRNFRLFLSPSRDVFSSKFKVYSVDEKGRQHIEAIDVNSFYTGRVYGEISSSVRAHLDDGLLTVSITIPEDVYIVEPLWRHDPNETDKMVAYKVSDIKNKFDVDHQHEGHGPEFCASLKDDFIKDQSYFKKYTNYSEDKRFEEQRSKRQTAEQLRRKKCSLLLVADFRFFRQLGGSDTKKTANYLVSLIDRVNEIFENTEWKDSTDQKGISGMGFVIKKILIHTGPTQVEKGKEHYNMEKIDSWVVKHLLEVFSRSEEHKNFCLAHLFTDQKFEGGILGLAYVGSPRRNSVGGICTPEYFKDDYTLNLNTGLSSSRNHYNQIVVTREADLVTAHELGHNWGSEHDPDITECSPSSNLGGSYIMYTYSVSGYDTNNKLFSPCSLRSIKAVLVTKSSYCFSEREESFCGNFKVEKGEQCDAGLIGTSDSDNCCDKNCMFKPKAVCSDRNSLCCDNCQLRTDKHICSDKSLETCEGEAFCTGLSPDCPPSPPLNDSTKCLEKGECKNGMCLPFCETKGNKSCICLNETESCLYCCRSADNESECIPYYFQDVASYVQLPNGKPCIYGNCNTGKCERQVQDVVNRLWNIIEDVDLNKVVKFINDNIVGAVIIFTIIIWIPASCLINYVDVKRKEKDIMWTSSEWPASYPDSSVPPPYTHRPVYNDREINFAFR